MDYFRKALRGVSHHDEISQSVQVSLYIQKELWDWLLHFVKVTHKQTRDTIQPISISLAIPLFATAVLLGVKAAKCHIIDFLRKNWAMAVRGRNRAWEHVTESFVEVLATELNPDYFEQCTDHSDWLAERLYGVWVQEVLRKENFGPEYFPYGGAKHIFMCAFCQRWMTPELAKVLPCCSYLVVRRADGKIGYAHSELQDANFQDRIDELRRSFGTNRAMLWYLYGLLNAMKCEECDEYFQLCELSHCRHHPCPAEQCPQRTYARVYPCCNQLANSADTQKRLQLPGPQDSAG
ncbi:hypothetical protein RvY_15547 [Ramazzottius varieornatus]|uniref:Uncharacterized protein n=1 Tax=Ramazzottius varieornatus TaxID=947166 RepID=A0A1D1VVA6_RAMVA|nr:hypothetical protein RvY_15547 [Ramazzottius varieornatus]